MKDLKAENESLKDELRSQASYLTSFKKEISKLFSKSQSNKDENNENESEIREDSESGNMNKCEKCDFIGKTEGGLKTHMTTKHKTVSLRGYKKVT